MKQHLQFASSLAKLLDNQFKIGPAKIGIDPLIGLIPGIGDIVSFLFSLYLIWIGKRLKLPQSEINKMLKYLAIDLIVGAVPVVGEIGDFFYKANQKNWEILKKHSKYNVEDGEIVE